MVAKVMGGFKPFMWEKHCGNKQSLPETDVYSHSQGKGEKTQWDNHNSQGFLCYFGGTVCLERPFFSIRGILFGRKGERTGARTDRWEEGEVADKQAN